MKLYVKTILILLLPISVKSQSVERQVVASTGDFVQNTAGSLSFTVGEPVINLGTDGSKIITQGFQQPNIPTLLILKEGCQFSFYPNPTTQILSIETTLADNSFEVFDAIGRSYGFFSKSNGEIDFSALASGIYFIKVNCTNTKDFYRKFIKIN